MGGVSIKGAKIFLRLHGIPVPETFLAKNREEAVEYGRRLKKVAMKIVSPDISHKSEVGCVKIDPKDIGKAFEEIISNARKIL